MSYCCKMREKYLIGIVSEDTSLPTPVDAVDFTDFDVRAGDGRPVLRAKFCPFCGKAIDGPLRMDGPAAGAPDRCRGSVRIDPRTLPSPSLVLPPEANAERRAAFLGRCAARIAEVAGMTVAMGMRHFGLPEPIGFIVDVRAARPEDFVGLPPLPGNAEPETRG